MARFQFLERWRRPVEPVDDRDHIVFVLSGGSVRGAAQAGMIRVLLDHGIVPDEVVGVSAGALNGTFLAANPTVEQARLLEGVWRDVADRKPIRGSFIRNVAAIVRGRPSFDNGDRLRALIADHAPMEDLAQASVPCHVGTTDASTGQLSWWTSGPLVDLLCATTAVPGVLPAVDLGDGTLHIDGGVVSNIPLRRALSLAPTRLVVLDVAAKFTPATKQTALSLMLVGFRAAAAELTRQQWLDVPADLDVLHIELPTVDDAPDFEFELVPDLLVQGAQVAEEALATVATAG
ncbi:MAG: patatin-like phospholipase family protein [Acidimicrobiales bacterium]|nr:patatin-like phospholipase family protein [Acidimicrobiales bacterium]MDP6288303.1 patatin-like phospholipase family protein [Acidimicrobiales bacterium]MDP6910844.1 patatin-like phospholipase family protein [Acidimicrobiales bacterium]